MSTKTTFAGLTVLEPGEPLSTDGGSFLSRNPVITDHFLKLIKTHVHDGHAPLADPAVAPTLVADATGGTLPPDTTVTATYTLIDSDDGETLPAPVAAVTTAAPVTPPQAAPTAIVDYASGVLVADVYSYVLTLVDGLGGETTAGPVTRVTRSPGSPTASIELDGLGDIVAASPGATGWRLYRAKGSSDFDFLAAGAATDLSFIDDGTTPLDCGVQPPSANTTNGANQVTLTVPALPLGAVGFNIYVSTTGAFTSPSLLGAQRAPGEAGTPIVLGSIVVNDGQPPDVSTSIGGSTLIAGGGGGGSAGPYVPVVAQGSSFNGWASNYGATLAEQLAAGILWQLTDQSPLMLVFARLVDGVTMTSYDEISSGVPYVAANWLGDTAGFTWDATNNVLQLTGAGDQTIYGLTLAAVIELDYSIAAATWTTIIAGSWDGAAHGIALIMDRAAGTLTLADVTSLAPLTYTTIASLGAADAWLPPAAAANGRLAISQYGNRVWATDVDTDADVVRGQIVADLPPDLANFEGLPLLGGNTADPTAFSIGYFSGWALPEQRVELVAASVSMSSTPQDAAIPALQINAEHILVRSDGDPWTPLVFTAPWTQTVGEQPLEYRQRDGRLELHGAVEGGLANTTITTVPIASGYTMEAGPIAVHPDGTVEALAAGPLRFNISLVI